MLDLYTRHIPLDQISVADNLKASGQLEAVGGQAYILELASNSFALVNWQNHVEIVKRTSILRDLIRASGEIRSLAYDAPDELRAGQVQDADWAAIIEASSNLSKLKIEFDDTPALSILELRAKARRELRDAEKGLIIVDYLQLMQPPQARRDGNRAVEVAEISRGLKVLAKEMDMPVIALSQLSRAVEMRGKKRPMLSDLRESGAIEQDADIVMFIDRSMDEMEAESEDRPDLGTAELIVAKHRNGPTRDITLAFNAEYTRFMDFIDDSRVPDYM